MKNFPPPMSLFEMDSESIQVDGQIKILVSQQRLRNFVSMLLDFIDVDEAWYLEQYPNVRRSILCGEYASAQEHYREVGYFSGHLPFAIAVDDEWYKNEYGDIRKVAEAGNLPSLEQHFVKFGYSEGRFPNGRIAARLSQLQATPSVPTVGKINIALIGPQTGE